MQRVYKTFVFMIVFTSMFSAWVFAQDNPPEPPDMPPVIEPDQGNPAENIEMMHMQEAEIRQAAEEAQKNGTPEQAEELNERADSLRREFDEHAREIERDRLRRAEEQLERLRNMTRQAEEIVNNLRGDMARREMAIRRPEPEPIFRPFPEQPGPGPQMDILIDIGNQIRDLLAAHLDRTEQAIRQNRERTENMERRVQELREQNERLRMELRERNEANRELEREIRRQAEERMESQRQQLEQRERQMRQRNEEQAQRQAEQRERQRRQRNERREQLEQQREDLELQIEPEVPIERPEEIENEAEVEPN